MKRLITLLLLIAGFTTGAWALSKDTGGYYLIGSVQDWQDFAALVETTPDANARMTGDIDLGDDQTMIGTISAPYQGTFDGQGHTLTVNYNIYIIDHSVAPFACVGDATIQNLHVDGSLIQQLCGAGGVAGTINGNLTVKRCWVSAYIYVYGEGNLQGTIGGIASYCDNESIRDKKILIEDCMFSGNLGTGYHCGSMMSHVNGDYNNSAELINCLNLGTCNGIAGSTGTFIRTGVQGDPYTITNCYYKTAWGTIQGTQATNERLADGTIATALQAGRSEEIWVQDPQTNLPMLSVFIPPTIHPTEYKTCCEKYEWHGQTYTTSGTYTYEEKNNRGKVTDIYTMELTVNYSTKSDIAMEFYVGDHYATDLFDFTVEKGGTTTYYATTTNAAGCDSIITLTINILEPQTFVTNVTINAGESYEWRGNVYTVEDTYTDEVYTEYGGVKEIYVLNLTVKEPEPGPGPGPEPDPDISQDTDGTYLIASAAGWKAFAKLIETEPAANARMIKDIDLGNEQIFIGTSEIPYEGTFDGQGHTLTVNLEREYDVAPFANVKGATIERLHVTGSCYATQCAAAGFVAAVTTEETVTTIRECWSSVYLKAGTEGSPSQSLGGIIVEPGENTLITDCLFDGRFDDQNTYWCGGFANWSPYHFTISNSLNLGNYTCSDYWAGGTFTREDSGWGGATFDNIYYKNAYGVEQGTQATDEQLADGGRTESVWVQDPQTNLPTLAVFAGSTPEPSYVRGDANGDGEIGMPDVMFVVNYILGNPADTFNADAADANLDGEIGMPDVMFIVNYILNGKFPDEE